MSIDSKLPVVRELIRPFEEQIGQVANTGREHVQERADAGDEQRRQARSGSFHRPPV